MSRGAGSEKGLSWQQQRFVDALLADPKMTAHNAAIQAGYSAETARARSARILALPAVAAALRKGMAARSERTHVDQDYVVSAAVQVVERCMQRAPVAGAQGAQLVDDDGRHVWQFDARGAVAALGLLAKHVGIGVASVHVNIDFDKLTDEQIDHLADGGNIATMPR